MQDQKDIEYALKAIGGQALWEASAEVRIPVSGNFGTAVFVDASDVTRAVEFRISHPHLSVGAGLRYQTPVGPLRADFGFRIPCAQILGTETVIEDDGSKRTRCFDLPPETLREFEAPGVLDDGPQGTIFGLPMAVSIAIGEAF